MSDMLVVGLIARMAVLWLVSQIAGLSFAIGQAIATVKAMIGNFALNNFIVHRD